MIRLGAPSSDPIGCALESTCKGSSRRISLRAWHPLVNIPAQYFSIEEIANALGLTIVIRKRTTPRRPLSKGQGI